MHNYLKYIYMCHKFEIIGHASGLAFGLLLDTGLSWALGRVLVNLLLGSLRLLLGLRNHLVHNLLYGGCYTYAYDMRNAIMTCNDKLVIERV